ncbi:hypothetical protein VKT23_012145 [Stygiomarasmius scandens]|uniref:Uncharacterized protein n=1 Tax=Marasmiellus scandens TaxID=2682957 RepID=A0ABR1J718_9AGAR
MAENPKHLCSHWIEVPNFDIDSTITRVILAKSQHDDQDDNVHLDLANLSLQPTTTSAGSSPLSSPPSSRQSSPTCTPNSSSDMSISAPSCVDMQGAPADRSHSASSGISTPGWPDIAPPATPSQTQARKTRRSKKNKVDPKGSTLCSVQKKKTSAAHDRRRKKRKLESKAPKKSRSNTTARVLTEAKPIIVQWDCLPTAIQTSGYIGKDWVEGPGKVWTLEEMVGPESRFKFQLVQWDGKQVTSIPIIDKSGRIFVVLVGSPPGDTTWEGVHEQAALLLDHYRLTVTCQHIDHPPRRNVWCSISVGYLFGGGQKNPKLFNQTPMNQLILEDLLSSDCFQRISGHVSAAMATWAPKLHKCYTDALDKYASHDPHFRRNFPRTAFAAATFNFDDPTETFEHLDYFNFVFGWCGVTALGSFDYHRGGHLILWDLKLVIEFPPGSSILLPSSYLRHSNTSVSSGEKRFSFTEYSAGGLFRYMDDGMRTRVSMQESERKQREQEARKNVKEGLGLYSTLEQLLQSCN